MNQSAIVEPSKHVFISYRRLLSLDLAARVRDFLVGKQFDVFFDITDIPSGRFSEMLLHQIEARPLFVPILVPQCFERATDPGDWFRCEIEHALAKKRHIVPVVAKGFPFPTTRAAADTWPGRLGELIKYHYIELPDRYFQAAMEALDKGLSELPREIDIRPTPVADRDTVSNLSEIAKVARPDAAGTSWIVPPMSDRRRRVSSKFWLGPMPTLRKEPSAVPLPAPRLVLDSRQKQVRASGRGFVWNGVEGARAYVLEKDTDLTFAHPLEIYRESFPSFHELDDDWADLRGTISTFYRVKAVGGRRTLDSEWSNTVAVDTPTWR